ncbi:flippase [Mesonia maritima]|uniref:O-antigen/teichoic acid export membrane protein n=1 Tax=Mesonia maritima TaxID=1793873 RepID=A0ABU1K2H6_9FLAO|nr:flippase [Mesonia maritima]MDR6299814.1 O-antigen/teichoic acid export membrane protein [Mesonia maritima]
MKKRIAKLIKNPDSEKKDILKKGTSYLFFKGGGMLGGYLFTYLIAQKYGASVNGLVMLSFSIFVFASMVSRLGADVNLVKFYADEDNWKENPGIFYKVLLKTILFSGLLSFIIYLFKDIFVISIFKKPRLDPYLTWIILTIPFWVIVSLCANTLRAKGLNNWYAFLSNTGRFLFASILLVLFSYFSFDFLNALKAHFYGILFLAILGLAVVIYNFKNVSVRSKTNSWHFLKESFPMMLSSTIIVLLGWMDTFILGIYETDDAVGVYGVALKIAAITSFSLEALNSVLAPKISNLYKKGDKASYKKLIRFSTNLNFIITILIVGIIIVFNKWLLGIFGDEFKTGTTALVILSIIYIVNSASGSVGIVMQMTGYQKQYRNIAFIALMINLLLNFSLIPIYGISGAAIASVISLSFLNITGAVFLKKKENLVTYFNPLNNN